MTVLFLTLFNLSIMATWTVLIVLLLRPLLCKAPKWTVCLLWAIVALRLLLPVSLESSISLIPSAEVIPTDIAQAEHPAIYSGIPQVDSAVNPVLLSQADQPVTLKDVIATASVIWATGLGLMLAYSALSWILLRTKIRASLHLRDRIYVCDNVQSPFVLGVIRPRIYIPSGLDEGTLEYVLAHETAHIRRRDHWWKPLGYLLLSIYWFNPLLWIGYILLCRDIERACDEKVLTAIGETGKSGYVNALLSCSTHRRLILTCPVAFGEVGVASRIKSALRYKKPAFWVVIASLILCCGTVVCFLTNPEACPHVYTVEVNAASTCTHEGIETRTCRLCQHSYMAYTDLCPHTYGEATVVQAPNCAQEGQASVRCIHCGAVQLQSISKDADAHDMAQTALVEATCAKAGVKTFTCTRCGHTEQQELPQKEHQYKQKITQEATCQRHGSLRKTCTQCGYSYEEQTPKAAHQWVKAPLYGFWCDWCQKDKPETDTEITPINKPQSSSEIWDIFQFTTP